MKKAGLFTILMVLSTFTVVNSQAQMPTKPDYVQTAIKYFDPKMPVTTDAKIEKLVQSMDNGHLLTYPFELALMYESTKDIKYLNRAEEVFKLILNDWKKNENLMKNGTFALTRDVTILIKVLKDNGRLGNEYDPILIKLIDRNFAPNEITDHNQIQARALGAVRAYKLFPNAPNAPKWKAYADTIWNFWYKNRDVDESSTNYEGLDLKDIISMADESGRNNLLKTKEIKKWFDRYRDLQAPSGFLPEYADDHFYTFETYISVFERVARLFNDPTYLYAAWKLYNTGMQNLSQRRSSESAALLAEISTLPPMNLKPEMTKAQSLVTTRTNKYGTKNIPNLLLLAASRNLGVPFVISDLYARGSHAHAKQRGGINYFESDNYPFYHGVSRHVWDARATNTIVVEKTETDGFPFSESNVRAITNKWFTDQLDLNNSPVINQSDSSIRGFNTLQFRIANVKKGSEVYIDNIRLEGKAGVKMLQTFDLETGMNNKNVVLTDDAVNGKAVKITHVNGITLIGIKVPTEVSMKDYRFIKLDWKHKALDNSPKEDIEFVVRTEGFGATMGDMDNQNKLLNAETNVKGADCYGEIVLDDHFVPDTKLTRRMVLTKEGVLVLQDYLEPSEEADGMTAGAIWQLYKAPNKQGTNWFNAPSEQPWVDMIGKPKDKELLVYFEQAEGRTYGGQQEDYTLKPYTVHAKQFVKSNQPVTFTTILIPHNPTDSVEDIEKSIVSSTTGRDTKISLTINGKKVNIQINKDKSWKVER